MLDDSNNGFNTESFYENPSFNHNFLRPPHPPLRLGGSHVPQDQDNKSRQLLRDENLPKHSNL